MSDVDLKQTFRDQLLAGADFSPASTDRVVIQYQAAGDSHRQDFSLNGQTEFHPEDALQHLLDLWDEGFEVSATLTVHLGGDLDAD